MEQAAGILSGGTSHEEGIDHVKGDGALPDAAVHDHHDAA